MQSLDATLGVEWFETPLPRIQLWLDLGITVALVVMYAILLSVTGFLQGKIVLPASFAVFFGASLAFVWYGHLRRSPSRIGFSDQGVHVDLRRRGLRIDWHSIEDVDVSHHLGDYYADIYYPGRRREFRVHVHGKAALELKRRFEELRSTKKT